MKRWMGIIFRAVIAIMCMLAMTVSAFAVETPKVTVSAAVSLTGGLSDPAEEYTIVLKANDAAYPMPEGTKAGEYGLTINGEGKENFPEIAYKSVGIYTYTITQVAGTNEKCTYDKTVYTLTVQITNAKDGDGLEATAVLYADGDGNKKPCAEFTNEYEEETATEEEITTKEETTTAAPTTTAPTTADAQKKSSNKILGVEDYSNVWGMLLIAAGVCVILLVVKEMSSKKDK